MPRAERRRRKAKPRTTPPRAPTIPGHCSTSPRRARAVEDEVDRAGLALQRFDRFWVPVSE